MDEPIEAPRRLSVAWVTDRVGHGGDCSHLLTALRYGHRGGAIVHVIALQSAEPAAIDLQAAGAAVHALDLPDPGTRLDPWWSVIGCVRLFLLLRKLRPEALFVLGDRAMAIGPMAARMAGVPRVAAVARRPPSAGGLGGLASWIGGRLPDLLFATSEGIGAAAGARLGVHPRRVVIAEEGIDLGTWSGRARAREAGAAPRLATLSRLVDGRDFTALFDAIAMLREFHPKLTLDVYGGGPAGLRHLRAMQRAGLEDCVRLHGEVEHPEEALLGVDVLVQPAGRYGVSRSVLEAMAMGVPVVIPRTSILRAAFPEESGLRLVPAGRASAIADAVDELLTDRKAHADAARLGRAFVLERHRAAAQGEAYARILEAWLPGTALEV